MSIVNDTVARATPASLDIAEEAQSLLAEANANTQAMIDSLGAIIRAETVEDVVRATLDTIRKEFGWTYASYWTVDPVENALVFSLESGRVDDEFQRLTRTARFKEGEGLNGRVLAAPRLVPRRRRRRAARLLPCPAGAPRRRPRGRRFARDARRPGRRNPRLLLDAERGESPPCGSKPCGSSAARPRISSPPWRGWATSPGSSRWSTTRRST